MSDGSIVELKNVHEDAKNYFLPDYDELLAVIDGPVVAMWHTHTHESANLSSEDWQTFLTWPQLEYAIIAKDEVRFYGVKGRGVVNLPLPEDAQ